MSVQLADARQVGSRKWRVPQYDHGPGMESWVHISYPCGADVDVKQEHPEITAAIHTINPDTGAFTKETELILKAGQRRLFQKPGFMGPIEVDFSTECNAIVSLTCATRR